ncbi:MAG: HDIG domain-containing protein [Clostridiales bacterium]|nr:HDIG domain-containing protein [Clostridiales bacterium]
MQAVEPVVFKQGQNIVVRGEGRIKANQIAMLNTLGLLNNNEIDYRMYVGAFLTMAALLALTIVLLLLTAPQLMQRNRLLILIYLTLLAVTLLCLLAKVIHIPYLAPFLLPAFLITVTVGTLPGLIVNTASSAIAALILGSSSTASVYDPLTMLLTGLIAGSAVTVILSRRGQRSLVMVAGGAATLLSFLSVLAVILLTASGTSNLWEKPLYAAGGAMLSTALCLAAQPLAETAFNLPTNNRLMELSNPNQPLLRRLLLEAPGTYHHSILIANMAEASAEAVGANPLLARVGGYYHDIGKLKRPLYFKENQIGTGNVHDSTDPAVSAAIITAHIRDGLALAKQYHLPLEVQQIVVQHHGNSRVKYFYTKAIKESGEAVDEQIFAYDGTPPQSAEAAIVMLCDTIEAAVRTLNNPTTDEIHSFIWKLIRGKIDDGQLANAPLTMKNLYSIQETCANVVQGIFHERIEYPSDEKLSALERIRSNLKHSAQKGEGAAPKP